MSEDVSYGEASQNTRAAKIQRVAFNAAMSEMVHQTDRAIDQFRSNEIPLWEIIEIFRMVVDYADENSPPGFGPA